MTVTGVNLAVGIMAAIGDIRRFNSPQKLVSYFGLNPRVRQSGLGAAHQGRISKIGRSPARALLVETAWQRPKRPVHCMPFLCAFAPVAPIRLPRSPRLASSLCSPGIC